MNKVVCINHDGDSSWGDALRDDYSNLLTIGKSYSIINHANIAGFGHAYYIICDDNLGRFISMDRFTSLGEYRDSKIKSLIDE